MATVKIVLDKKKNNQRTDGSFPIKIKVEHDGKHLPINLKKYALVEQWTGDKLNSKFPNSKRTNNELLKKLVTAKSLLEDYENEIKTWSCKQLRDFIALRILDEKSEKRDKRIKEKGGTLLMTPKGIKTIKLFEYGNTLVEHYEKLKLYGRAKSYKQALSAFRKYSSPKEDITFAEITGKVLEQWKVNMMNKPMKDTSYNAYLRGLRAVINHGIKDHKLTKDGNYGFQYFTVGTPQPTQKRAIHIEQIKSLFEYSLEKETSLWHSQQQAIFMFNTNGINFRDLAYLRMNQIIGDFDRIKYKRAKNHKDFDIVIAGKSKEILQYYSQGKKLNSNELVFPILPQQILGLGKKEITLYESRRDIFNNNLKKIASLAKIDTNLTSYVLRHSFATALKHSGANISYISEALGHESSKTTQVYLDSFEKEDNDNITRSVAF
ncbi:Tyr recombinase domain-containing protein [Tenacibaculum sp. 190524A02b]|uniref:tyrosine-type recombinase/integrase n=1 Tax=Tenacibaculum vairaonense TaxID=3137860 RepID=UPI0032B1954D